MERASSRSGRNGGNSSVGGGGGGGRRRWLLAFMGSLDVCCDPGKSIRRAMRRLLDTGANESVQILHFGRADGRPLPGRTAEERSLRYRAAGEQLATSRFCLVPAGDNEVSSRLYSAISAGCVPVVVANQLSGAFASLVPYPRFWLRVEQQAFISNPFDVVRKLRAIPLSDVLERRARMLRYVADVTYEQPVPPLSPQLSLPPLESPISPGRAPEVAQQLKGRSAQHNTGGHGHSHGATSRLATNLLLAAYSGCVRGVETSTTGVYPPEHPYARDDRWGLNCSCTLAPPRFFHGGGPHGSAHQHALSTAARNKLWTRGRVPTEVCRCLHCATLCPPSVARGAEAPMPSDARKAHLHARSGKRCEMSAGDACPPPVMSTPV